VSPVKYEQGFYIPEHGRGNIKAYIKFIRFLFQGVRKNWNNKTAHFSLMQD
jgi:hypothetical protein